MARTLEQAKQRKQRETLKRKTMRFESAIREIQKEKRPDQHLSAASIYVINTLVQDLINRLVTEADKLLSCTDRKALSAKDLKSALDFVL